MLSPDAMLSISTGQPIAVDLRLLCKDSWLERPEDVQSLLQQARMAGPDADVRGLAGLFLEKASIPFVVNTEHPAANCDVILVLGNVLNKDATPKPELIARLEGALKAFERNPDARILTSGGGNTLGVNEAELMRRWLIDKGVSASQILVESKSRDTVENLLFSADILAEHHARNVLLITGQDHVTRAHHLLQACLDKKGLDMSVSHFACVAPGQPAQPVDSKVAQAHESFLLFKDLGRVLDVWKYQEWKSPSAVPDCHVHGDGHLLQVLQVLRRDNSETGGKARYAL